MVGVTFTDEANKNLINLLKGIKKRFDLKVATRVKDDIKKTINHARIYPQLGKIYRDDIRFLIIRGKTIMFYRSDGKSILIITFFDARQNWMKLL